MDESVSRSQDHSNVFATDKRRMLWLINTQALSSIGDEGVSFARRLKVEWPKNQRNNVKRSPGKPLLDSDIRFPDTGESAIIGWMQHN